MKRLNVIDLDGTLLPYDSLSRWVLHFKTAEGLFSPLRWWGLRYRFGWMDRSAFVRRCVDHLRRREDYESFNRSFAERLARDFSPEIRSIVRQHSDAETVNVLCSASPDDYVKHLAAALGWECRATGYRPDGHWQLLYGAEKLRRIREDFPDTDYVYHFAIADDASDEVLLHAFRESERIRSGSTH
jgi:hypothetical protein